MNYVAQKKNCYFIPQYLTNNYNIVSGIGMDSSVTPVRHGGLSLVQTTDFFYPLVDDPYMMGKKEDVEPMRTL